MQTPGPGEPEYEAPDESAVIIPMADPDDVPTTRPASAAPSESASALPGAIDSDPDSGEGEEEGGDAEEQQGDENDEEEGRRVRSDFCICYEVLVFQVIFPRN